MTFKRSLYMILIGFVLAGCANHSVEDVRAGLSVLQEYPVEKAFEYLGFPDAEQTIAGKTVYSWSVFGSYRVDVPQTSRIRKSTGETATVNFTRPTLAQFSCRVRLITQDQEIESWDIAGDSVGCQTYAKRLEPLLNTVETDEDL